MVALPTLQDILPLHSRLAPGIEIPRLDLRQLSARQSAAKHREQGTPFVVHDIGQKSSWSELVDADAARPSNASAHVAELSPVPTVMFWNPYSSRPANFVPPTIMVKATLRQWRARAKRRARMWAATARTAKAIHRAAVGAHDQRSQHTAISAAAPMRWGKAQRRACIAGCRSAEDERSDAAVQTFARCCENGAGHSAVAVLKVDPLLPDNMWLRSTALGSLLAAGSTSGAALGSTIRGDDCSNTGSCARGCHRNGASVRECTAVETALRRLVYATPTPEMGPVPEALCFFSPRHTASAPHYDGGGGAFIAQIVGRKRVVLLPPTKGYHRRLELLSAPHPSARHPSLRTAEMWRKAAVATNSYCGHRYGEPEPVPGNNMTGGIVAMLQPGDVLFIPPRWVHHVLAVDDSMSCSIFTPAISSGVGPGDGSTAAGLIFTWSPAAIGLALLLARHFVVFVPALKVLILFLLLSAWLSMQML